MMKKTITNEDLKRGFERLQRQFEIEERIWNNKATVDDFNLLDSFLKEDGELPSPRTMYVIGLAYHCGSGVEYDPKKGDEYWGYVKKHGNGEVIFTLSYAYSRLGDEFMEQSIGCLKLAKKKRHKLATAMLKAMEETPYELPKA